MNWCGQERTKTKERIGEEAYEQAKELKKGRTKDTNEETMWNSYRGKIIMTKEGINWRVQERKKTKERKYRSYRWKIEMTKEKKWNWQGPERMKYRKKDRTIERN